MQAVLRWISSLEHEWLLVFDNADVDPHVVAQLMPRGNMGNVLITSRNPNMQQNAYDSEFVEDMEKEDAIALFLKAALLDESSDQLRLKSEDIVEKLCFLPLAIDQAGAAIASGFCSVHEYLEKYLMHRDALLDDPWFKGASKYGHAVYGTWDLSFQAIKASISGEGGTVHTQGAESAILTLQIFAFLHNVNIGEIIFKRAAEASGGSADLAFPFHKLLQLDHGAWNDLYFKEGIRVLLSFSLIKLGKRNMFGNMYSMHALVHSWSQYRMPAVEKHAMCQSVKTLLSHSIRHSFASKDHGFHQTFVSHIDAFIDCTVELGVNWTGDGVDLDTFGRVYDQGGYWKKAENLYDQLFVKKVTVLGAEHPDTLGAMANLAVTFWNQGKWKDAEELEMKVLDMTKRILGAEHPDTLTSMANLAATFWNQGKWKDAEELEVQVLDMRKRILEEHPDTLTAMANLVATFGNKGKWKDAEVLEVQVLDMRKRILGAEHPDTLTAMANLAGTFRNQGKWKDAEELEVQVLDMRKRILGAEHPDTLTAMANMAATFR